MGCLQNCHGNITVGINWLISGIILPPMDEALVLDTDTDLFPPLDLLILEVPFLERRNRPWRSGSLERGLSSFGRFANTLLPAEKWL